MRSNAKPLQQLLTLAMACFMGFVLTIIVTFVCMVIGGDEEDRVFLLSMTMVSQLFVFLLPALLMAILYGRTMSDYLRLRGVPRMVWLMLLGAAVMVVSLPFIECVTQFNEGWHFPAALQSLEQHLRQQEESSAQQMETFLSVDGVGAVMFNVVVIALTPAICEEFFFRGALQTLLGRWLRSPHWGIVLTAAVFSLAHGEFFAFLPRFVMGIILGYCFYLSGSIWVGAAAHFLNNAFAVVAYAYCYHQHIPFDTMDGIGIPWYLVVLSLLVTTALMLLLVRYHRRQTLSTTDSLPQA